MGNPNPNPNPYKGKRPTTPCSKCNNYGHWARKCHANQTITSNPINTIVESSTANFVQSTPPIKDYDVVPDIWNAQVHVTVGELLTNDTYRTQALTALNTVHNTQSNNPFCLHNVQ